MIRALQPTPVERETSEMTQQGFLDDGLRTNTAKRSIPLEAIISGGPPKDGIPAITEPRFIRRDEAGFLSETDQGIVLTVGGTTRFYPYRILNWHEVVNDTIEGEPVLVTYCPLCGTAIVYERRIDGKTPVFGVSGKLYESNLLMYDRETESLWSQALGEAVVGDELGKTLELLLAEVVTFEDVRRRYPDAEILSVDTGFQRAYDVDPYAEYMTRPELLFPVSVQDARFPAKELMYIVNVGDYSIAFPLKDLIDARRAVVDVGERRIVAEYVGDVLRVHWEDMEDSIPGYYSMWFSWAVFHAKDGIVWRK
jgi:hypothetical protein